MTATDPATALPQAVTEKSRSWLQKCRAALPAQFKTALKVLLSLAVLGLVFVTAGLESTLGILSKVSPWLFVAGVGIYIVSQGVSAYRWQFLSRPLGFDNVWREFFDYYMLGMYFNLFLPGSIGGDVSRIYYLAKSQQRRKREALLTLLAERGVGLVALLILTGAVCLTPYADPIPTVVRWGVLTLCLTLFVGFIGLHLMPLDRLVTRFPKLALLQQARVYWQDVSMLAKSVAISLLVHGFMVWIHWMIAGALGVSIHPVYLVAVYGIAMLVSVIPLFFNGIGVREGAYQLLLTRAGLESSEALAFALCWFLIATLTSLSGGIIFIRGHYRTPPAPQADDEALEA